MRNIETAEAALRQAREDLDEAWRQNHRDHGERCGYLVCWFTSCTRLREAIVRIDAYFTPPRNDHERAVADIQRAERLQADEDRRQRH